MINLVVYMILDVITYSFLSKYFSKRGCWTIRCQCVGKHSDDQVYLKKGSLIIGLVLYFAVIIKVNSD